MSDAAEVPTTAEAGFPEIEGDGWVGALVPAGTPKDIIARLNAAFTRALKDPAVADKIATLGAEPAPTSPEDFAKFIASESAKWGKLVSEAGIKAN